MKLSFYFNIFAFLFILSCTNISKEELNSQEKSSSEKIVKESPKELIFEQKENGTETLDAGNKQEYLPEPDERKEETTAEKKPVETLSCEEAISMFKKLLPSADRSCATQDDCIILGSMGDCNCYQTVFSGTPSAYSKKNDDLTLLHQRIFSADNGCLSSDLLPCIADFTRGTKGYSITCENSLCSTTITNDTCP